MNQKAWRFSVLLCALMAVRAWQSPAQPKAADGTADEVPTDAASRLAFWQRQQLKKAVTQFAFHDFRTFLVDHDLEI